MADLENLTVFDNVTVSDWKNNYRLVVVTLYSGILPPLILLGTVFNVIAIRILWRNKNRIPSIIPLLGVSIADMFLLPKIGLYVTVVNLRLFHDYPSTERYTQIFAEICPFLNRVLNVWMIYPTMLVAMERAFAINKPLKVHVVWTRSRCVKAVAVMYGFGVIVGIGVILRDVYYSPTLPAKEPPGWLRSYVLAELTVMRILPLSVLVVCNALIIRGFRRNAADMAFLAKMEGHNSSNTKSSHLGNLLRLTKTLFVVTLLQMLCIVPGLIFGLICLERGQSTSLFITEPRDAIELSSIVIVFVEFIHCCVNAAMYILGDRKFRQEVRKMFRLGKESRYIMKTEDTSYIPSVSQSI